MAAQHFFGPGHLQSQPLLSRYFCFLFEPFFHFLVCYLDIKFIVHLMHYSINIVVIITGKNNGFPFLDILGYLKNTHENPKFGKVRQVPTREFPTKFPGWDLSHSSKFGIFVGIL